MSLPERRSRISLERENEGKSCDAVLRVIEERAGQLRECVGRPELDPRLPPVELTAFVGNVQYALEHTLVEAFANQERGNKQFQQFLEPIRKHFDNGVPYYGVFEVTFPFDMSVGPAALVSLQKETINELERVFGELAAEINEVPDRSKYPRGREQRLELMISRKRTMIRRELHWDLSPAHDGYVDFARYLQDFKEEKRSRRIETSLDRKLPKLAAWAARGARTVLILENSDIALSNFSVIGETTTKLIAPRSFAPDEIYIVSTALDRWSVHCLKRGKQYWPDDEAPGRYWNFRRTDLVNLTAGEGVRGG